MPAQVNSLIKDLIESSSLAFILTKAQKLPIKKDRTNYVVVASRSHMSSETYTHIENLKWHHKIVEIVNTGSSIKMCLVAEGVADEYSVVDIFLWTEFDFAELIDLVLKLKTGSPEQFTFRQ